MRKFRADSIFQKQFDTAGQLDGVDPAMAKLITQSGLGDGDVSDDKVSVSKASFPASSLSPSQTTMVLEKALGMAIGMLASGKIGGDLGALISKDGHILDGHHRWAATIIASGKKGHVGGYAAALPGSELLKVLNLVSKGSFGVRNGKPGKGSIAQFTPANVRKLLETLLEKGVSGEYPLSPEKIKAILVKNFGSVEAGVQEMSDNVKYMKKDVPSWAPDRAQMPVIEPEQVPEAAALLSKGEVDWNFPYKQASRKLVASNRGPLIRLAKTLPGGSPEKRQILALLKSAG